MSENDDGLLREVKEEIRREQMERIWKRYSGLILGAAVLVVLGVAGYQYIETRRVASEQAAGAKFSAAETLSDDKKKDDAAKAFKAIADDGPAGYAALAKLRLASAQAKAGKTAEAIATFDSLAKQSGGDDLLKSFAELQAASLLMADADYTEIQNRLTPLMADGAPFADTAKEFLGIAAYKAKKYDEARKYLEPLLIDPDSPPDLQERVKVVMGELASAEVAVKTPAAASASKPAAAPAAAATPSAKPDEPAKTDAKPSGTGDAPGTGAGTGTDKK